MLTEVESGKVVGVAGVKPFVVVGVPAFNEEKTIARVVLEALKCADRVVVCDDGSTDLTGDIAERLGADVVRHERNLGYGAAVQSLFRRARELNADVLVTLDADGQHFPSEIPNVVGPIVDGVADVVVGSRFVDERLAYTIPWYRRTGIKFITKILNGTSKHGVKDAQSGFRAYSRRALETLVMFEDGPVRQGIDVVMSIVRLVVEDKPLTLLGVPGILCLIVGAVFGVWMLQIYAAEHRIVTNVALASVAFILLGFFALSTAITLYAISRLAKKTNRK